MSLSLSARRAIGAIFRRYRRFRGHGFQAFAWGRHTGAPPGTGAGFTDAPKPTSQRPPALRFRLIFAIIAARQSRFLDIIGSTLRDSRASDRRCRPRPGDFARLLADAGAIDMEPEYFQPRARCYSSLARRAGIYRIYSRRCLHNAISPTRRRWPPLPQRAILPLPASRQACCHGAADNALSAEAAQQLTSQASL